MTAAVESPSALERLDGRIGRGWRLGLDGMRRCLARMEPLRFPVILVGGTNGKGSVCAMLHEYFSKSGLRTGLTTSPHLCNVRERIVVDGRMIKPDEFEAIYREIESIDDSDATYFETLALMAIRYFQKREVDLAVVEVGLGGRLDAFNALDPVVSVITSIGLEHTAYLGDTVEKIAVEKAAIARQERPVVLGDPLPALRAEVERIGARVVTGHCEERSDEAISRAKGDCFGPAGFAMTNATMDQDLRIERNLATASKSAEAFCAATGRSFDAGRFREIAAATRWPGRWEILPCQPGLSEIILDAAHNPHAAQALAGRLARTGKKSVVALAAFLGDKDVAGFVNALEPVASRWVITQVNSERALPVDEIPAPSGSERIPDLLAAFARARDLASPGGTLLVTGSIYLLGEIINTGLVGPYKIWDETFGAL